MIKTDVGTKIHLSTNESVFVVRITMQDGTNWYLVIWKDDNTPTLYNEYEFKQKFF